MIRTRLTEILEIEHPVMLAGMGGVSYHQLVAAVSEAGGFGTFGAATMSTEQMVGEIREAARSSPDKPFGVDLLTAAGDMTEQCTAAIDDGATGVRRRARRPRRTSSTSATAAASSSSTCAARSGTPCRPSRPAATSSSRRAPKPAATPARSPRSRSSPRSSTPSATRSRSSRPAASSTDAASPPPSPSAPTASGSAPASSPRPRRARPPGYKDALLRTAEDGTVISRAFTGKTLRALENSYTKYFEEHPEELQPFPQQMVRSTQDGAMHLGGDELTTGVDPDKECYPAGQGVGAINELDPGRRARRNASSRRPRKRSQRAATRTREPSAEMKFGIFFEISVPRPFTPEREKQVYDNCLEQVRVADELGFDYVWAVEHHFLEEYSHCSAPELFLTACAAQTKRIRVGHGIVVCVPQFNHPVRAAERAAVLDIISGGRLDFGTGRSATWTELGGFEADPDETKKTWDEYVRVIPKMWTQERFGWQGRAFSMPERAVLPKPVQKPHPPMWVAVTSPGTEIDAGRARPRRARPCVRRLRRAGAAARRVPQAHPELRAGR